MSRAITGFLVAVALLASAPASAPAATPAAIADRVTSEVVYVEPAARSVLPEADAGRVRLAILDAAIGRIKVAVVDGPTGGLGAVARRVRGAMDPPLGGALITTNGRGAAVTVTYPQAGRARAAVRRAFARGGTTAARLERAVRALGKVDPGPAPAPSGDPEATTPLPNLSSDPTKPVFDQIGDAVATTVFVVGAIVALPFLVLAGLLVARSRRRRTQRRDAFAVALDEARDDHVALGDGIRELDELSGSTAPTHGGAYALALDRYDEAGLLLAGQPSAAEVARARRAIADGAAAVRDARAQLTGTAPAPPR